MGSLSLDCNDHCRKQVARSQRASLVDSGAWTLFCRKRAPADMVTEKQSIRCCGIRGDEYTVDVLKRRMIGAGTPVSGSRELKKPQSWTESFLTLETFSERMESLGILFALLKEKSGRDYYVTM